MATASAAQEHSTALAQSPPRRRSRRALKILLWIVLLLALLAAGGAAYLYHAATRTLPQLDGSIALLGLSAPVNVTRDEHGVPHIVAQSEQDLFFAQGFITAQDRLWQLDMARRLPAGELAEVLGSDYVPLDRMQRVLQVRRVAERGMAQIAARERSHFEAYARGVNAYIAQQGDRLPVEFRLLKYRPKPWTAVDSLLCGVSMSEFLADNQWAKKLAREHITAALGPELAADLYVSTSWRDHPPGQDGGNSAESRPAPKPGARVGQPERNPEVAEAHLRAAAELLAQFTSGKVMPGSNNWAVSGTHTASGRPLLSNDMHLNQYIPNVWYEAQLEIRPPHQPATFDVEGFTLPGVPYVIVGHNQRIAWGITNLNPDVQDVYVERTNERGEYLTPSGWRTPEVRREIIHVKDAPDVTIEVRVTRHGPVVNDLVPGEKRTLALQWTLYEAAPDVPFFAVDSAQNWQEFRAAFARFTSPSSNLIYADVDGHIGYQATGQVPVRAAGHGEVPVSGADDAHEWIGHVPYDELPSVLDPPLGMVATANGRIVPDGYKYFLASEWVAPYRTERIYRLLAQLSGGGRRLQPADMLRIQTDIHSEFDHFCAQQFVYAVDHAANATTHAREAADVMRGWDGEVAVHDVAPTIVVAAERELWRLLLEGQLGPARPAGDSTVFTSFRLNGWRTYWWYMKEAAMENILSDRPQRWLPAQYKNFDELLAAAVDAAVTPAINRGIGLKSDAWKWGERHPLILQHPVFGRIPIVRGWSGPGRVPQSGDGNTVKQVTTNFGPSERMTVDFSNFDASTFNIVTGQSGQLFSRYYDDQWRAWYGGFTFPLAFSDAAVERTGKHTLTLQPQ
jgi:penicillin amidase